MIEPTGYTALDLVGFTDRGTYAANVNYVKNDLVHYGGSIWLILIDDTIGITPAEGPNYTIFMGEPSNIVERIIAPLEDNPATVAYTTGRQIIYNDYLYEVIDDISVGDTLITYEDDPTNANIKLASPVETQVLALGTRLTAAEEDISDLSDEVITKEMNIASRKFLLIGDSFLASGGWGTVFDSLAETTSIKIADGGIGYVNLGNTSGVNLATLISNSTIPSDITDAIIIAGINDCKAAGVENLSSAVQNAINAIKNKCPNIENIYGAFNATYFGPTYSDYANRYPYIGEAYRLIHANFTSNTKCIWLEAPLYAIQFSQFISSDSVHPNAAGYSVMGRAVVQAIKGHDETVSCNRTVPNKTMIRFELCAKKWVSIEVLSGTTLYNGNAISFTGGFVSIGTYSLPFYPKYTYHFVLNVLLYMNNAYHEGMILIRPSGEISVWSADNVSNVTGITIGRGAKITVPMFPDDLP